MVVVWPHADFPSNREVVVDLRGRPARPHARTSLPRSVRHRCCLPAATAFRFTEGRRQKTGSHPIPGPIPAASPAPLSALGSEPPLTRTPGSPALQHPIPCTPRHPWRPDQTARGVAVHYRQRLPPSSLVCLSPHPDRTSVPSNCDFGCPAPAPGDLQGPCSAERGHRAGCTAGAGRLNSLSYNPALRGDPDPKMCSGNSSEIAAPTVPPALRCGTRRVVGRRAAGASWIPSRGCRP